MVSEEYMGFIVTSIPPSNTMKQIRPIGQGSVPKELRGSYTNAAFAKQDIRVYVKEKEEHDAKVDLRRRSKQVQRRSNNGSK